MSIPVPFGQFVPGDSVVHALDARAKLGVTAALTVTLFVVGGWTGLVAVGVVVGLLLTASRVPFGIALCGTKTVMWLMLFTVLANALRWNPAEALLRVGPVAVVGPGLLRGLFFGFRILLLVMTTSLVTLTTSPVALTDALSSIMRPLRVVRVPVDDVATMLSIALRFVPTTAEEAERIVVAQSARGARFDEGGLLARARAWVPVLVPLFVKLFRRADSLALAMESRCYSGSGRTRLHEPVMRTSDWLALAASVAFAVAAGLLL